MFVSASYSSLQRASCRIPTYCIEIDSFPAVLLAAYKLLDRTGPPSPPLLDMYPWVLALGSSDEEKCTKAAYP